MPSLLLMDISARSHVSSVMGTWMMSFSPRNPPKVLNSGTTLFFQHHCRLAHLAHFRTPTSNEERLFQASALFRNFCSKSVTEVILMMHHQKMVMICTHTNMKAHQPKQNRRRTRAVAGDWRRTAWDMTQSTENLLGKQCALFWQRLYRRTHRLIEVCRIRRKLGKYVMAAAFRRRCHRHTHRQDHRHCHHQMEMKRSRYKAFTAKVGELTCQSYHGSRLFVTLISGFLKEKRFLANWGLSLVRSFREPQTS